jgi:hypothetical protein
MPPSDSRFIFNGEVVAFGAVLARPRRREVRGAVALPGPGGRVSSQEGPPDLGDIARFDYANSSVSGERYRNEEGDKEFETRATCTMAGLEVGDFLRADLVSAALTSRFVRHHRFHEEVVTLRGLWINGQDIIVRPTMLDTVRKCPTLGSFKERARKDGLITSDCVCPGTPREGGKVVQTSSGDLVCYLLEPHYIPFERGGTRFEIFLGEYLIHERERRLTMIRIEARPIAGGGHGPDRGDVARAAMRAGPAPDPSDGEEGEEEDLGDSTGVLELKLNGHTHP